MKKTVVILGLVLAACTAEQGTPDSAPPPIDSASSDASAKDTVWDVPGDLGFDILEIADALEDSVADADSTPVVDTGVLDTGVPGVPDVSPEVASDTGTSPDVAGDTNALPEGLVGVAPEGETALPTYTQVVDQTGATVPPDHLVGQWSVLWFYPKAGTKG